MKDLTIRKVAGFSLLALAVLTWVIVASLPFLGLSVAQLALGTTAIVIVGEGAFWLSMFFLGSQYWQTIKSFFAKPFSCKRAVRKECTTEA